MMSSPSFFLNAPAKVPRTVCCCQLVHAQICASVAPSGHCASETLVVEQFQQCCEALAVAVVRGRRKEQLVLEMSAKRTNGKRALRVGGVFAATRGRNVVGLIDYHQIISPRESRLIAGRQCLAEGAQRPLALEEVDRSD